MKKKNLFDSALEAAMAGNYDYAEYAFTKIITKKPAAYRNYIYGALVNRGIVYYKTGEFRKSLIDFNKAEKLDDTDPDLYINRGNLYAETGFFDKAVEDYGKAENLDSSIGAIYCNRGNAYRKLEKYEEAYLDLDKAVKTDPENTDAYLNRGLLLEELGDFKSAVNDYETVIKIDRNNTDAYYYLAKLYQYSLYNPFKAEDNLRKAARLGHPNARSQVQLNGILRN